MCVLRVLVISVLCAVLLYGSVCSLCDWAVAFSVQESMKKAWPELLTQPAGCLFSLEYSGSCVQQESSVDDTWCYDMYSLKAHQ